jgi:hypothetical protein
MEPILELLLKSTFWSIGAFTLGVTDSSVEDLILLRCPTFNLTFKT